MANWLEHSVQVEVDAPIDLVWELWSDLEQMPRWMKWIDSVKVLEENPDLSRWKLDTKGLEFTWLSRILNYLPAKLFNGNQLMVYPIGGQCVFMATRRKALFA